MAMFHKEMFHTAFTDMLNKSKPDDVAWMFQMNYKSHGMYFLSKSHLAHFISDSARHAFIGKLQVLECNKKTAKTFDGRTWYFFVIQELEDGKMVDMEYDIAGLMLLGEMVSGQILAFKDEKTRDLMFKKIRNCMTAKDDVDF